MILVFGVLMNALIFKDTDTVGELFSTEKQGDRVDVHPTAGTEGTRDT